MLKKYLVLLIALAVLTPLFADIILHQTFDSTDVIVPNAPTGWAIYDSGPNGKTWATTTSHPRSTPNCIRYNYSVTQPANDWFYTKALSLTAGIPYSLEFFYRGSNPFFTEKLEVYIDNDQTPPASGAKIYDDNNIKNTIYAQGLVDFTVPSTGTYYLGFHCYSAANQWNLRIDDITVYKDVHDVGVDVIYSPVTGTYNNTTVFKPKFLVRNYGQNTGGEVNVPVWCAFVRYPNYPTLTPAETLRLCYKELPRIEICNPETVWCDSWIPPMPCNHKFIAWTALQGDQNPANDKKEVDFSVDFRDVALLKIVIPRDTMLWCTESIPTDTVVNNGHQTESFWVFFKSLNNLSQQEYLDSSYVANLAPQEKRMVTFTKWHFPVCNHTAKSWTALVGDENHSNDTITKPYVIKLYDFEVVGIIDIPDTAQVCNWYLPRMIVHNNGQHTGAASAVAHMNIYRNGVLINQFSTQTRTLIPCQNDTIGFEWHADSACNHVIKAWVEFALDQNHANDTMWKNFVVKYYDVEAVSILNVPDTVAVCNDVTAKVVVHNKGLHVGPQQGWVYFNLYRSAVPDGDPVNPYVLIKKDSVLKTLTPCVNDTATFTFHADSASNHKIIAKVKYPFDQDPSNDSVIKYFVIRYYDWELIGPVTGVPETTQVCTWLYPSVNVHNNGKHTYAESARVYMDVYRNGAFYNSGYRDVFLPPCQTVPVTFEWHADSACNHEMKFYVVPRIAGHDANPNNDSLKKTFVVKWYDVEAVAITNLPDTIQYCTNINPKIIVHNNGIHVPAQTGWVIYSVLRSTDHVTYNPVYTDSVLKTLAYCVYDTVTFQYHPDTCWHRVTAMVRFEPDQNPANNTVSKDFVVRYYDVEAVSILNVPDTIDFCNNINPKIVVHNKGSHVPTQTGWVIYSVLRSHNMVDYYPIFTDSVQKTLAYCVYDTVTFSYHPDSACWHKVAAMVRFNPDQNTGNNLVSKDFVVRLYDFEIVRLKGIPDTIEQCNWFNPTVVIHNNGVHTGLQPSIIKLQVYRNGLPYGSLLQHAMPPLEPCHNDSFTFEIHADSFCNHTIKAWVEAPVDQNPANDTMWKNYVVTYHDVEAVSILNVPDTIDFCTTINPKIVVHNKGVHVPSQTGWVIYQVLRSTDHVTYNPVFTDSVLKTLAYCVYDTVTFSYHPDTCWHRVTATVRFNPDQNSANNTISKDFVVRYVDVEVVSILKPTSPADDSLPTTTIVTNDTFRPIVRVRNNGVHSTVTCTLTVKIYREATAILGVCRLRGLKQWDSLVCTMYKVFTFGPGVTIDVPMDTWRPSGTNYDMLFDSCVTHHLIRAEIKPINAIDQVPSNNMKEKLFAIKLGAPDVAVANVGLLYQGSLPVLTDSIQPGVTYNVVSAVYNSPMNRAASFRSWYKVVNMATQAEVYSRYLDAQVLPGQYKCLFPHTGWTPSNPGMYKVMTWILALPMYDMDTTNNRAQHIYTCAPTSDAKTNDNKQSTVIGLPKTFAMYQNNPNPFNGLTHIRWQIPISANVTISVYDASGRVIKTLVNDKRTPGYYNTTWNCTDENNRKVAAGIYFYEMRTNDYTRRLKMVITH